MAKVLFDPGPQRSGRHGTVVAGADEPDSDPSAPGLERNELNVSSIRAHRGTDVVEDSLDLVERTLNGGGTQIVWILARVGERFPAPADTSKSTFRRAREKVGFRRPAVNESQAEKGVRFPPLRPAGPGGVR